MNYAWMGEQWMARGMDKEWVDGWMGGYMVRWVSL